MMLLLSRRSCTRHNDLFCSYIIMCKILYGCMGCLVGINMYCSSAIANALAIVV